MNTRVIKASPIALRAVVMACLALPALAHAQLAPFAFTVGETVTHDDNVLRAPAGGEQADWQSDTRVRLEYADRIGRHEARAWASTELNRFRHSQQLNNNSYQLGGEFDWTSTDLWSGQVGFDANSSLYRTGQTGDIAYSGKSILHAQRAFTRFALGGVTRLRFEGGLEASRSTNSAAALALNDTSQWVGDLGVSYAQNPDLRLSTALRRTEGRYPNFVPAADDFHRNDLVFGANWAPGSSTDLQAQIAYSQETHSELAGRNYWSGFVRGGWQAGGHLRLSASLARDTNQNFAGGVLGQSTSPGAQTGAPATQVAVTQLTPSINNSASLSAHWDLTSKIDLEGTYLRTTRHYNNVLLGDVLVNGSDATSQYQISLGYQISRAFRLGCSVMRVTHSAGDLTAIGLPYESNAYSCLAEMSLH